MKTIKIPYKSAEILKAVEKQLKPKKPAAAAQPNYFWCPECSRAIKKRIASGTRIISNCPFCGQSLDWSGENEQ